MSRRMVLTIGGILFVFALIEGPLGNNPGTKREATSTPAVTAFALGCNGTNLVRSRDPTARDAVLGPVTIYSFRSEFERAKESEVFARGPAGVKVLKMPVVFGGTNDVTIAVPRRFRETLGLNFDTAAQGVDTVAEAKPAVRFRACPGDEATGYPGELLYGGPWPACVALEVSIDGRPPATHAVSLGAGPCRAPG